MKKISVIFVLISIQTFSQRHIAMDSVTLEPVPFANILIRNYGLYSDENGLFTINNYSNDSIIISHINYEKFKSTIHNISDTIFLKPKNINLEKIIIIGHKNKKNVIYKLQKRTNKFGSCPLQEKKELLTKITLKNKSKGLLKKIILSTEKAKELDTILYVAVRVNIYKKNKDTLKLIYSSDYKKIKTNERIKIIENIQNNTILLDKDDIYIGVENLGLIGKDGDIIKNKNKNSLRIQLTKDNENINQKTFIRNIFGNELFELDNYFKIGNKQYKRNMNIGLEIEIY